MSETLLERLDNLAEGADLSDPQTYSKLLGYSDEDRGAQPAQGDTAATPTAPAATVATESSAPPAAAVKPEAEAAGIATKDGKHVIPMAVLTDTRQALARANERADALIAENRRLEQEKAAALAAAKPAPEPERDEELEELETDFPQVAKRLKANSQENAELRAQVQEIAARTAQPPAVDPNAGQVQELIDKLPLLSAWQAKGGVAWREAVARDDALRVDPAWGTRTQAERFAEVQRQIADELGIPNATPTAQAQAQTPEARPAPAAAPVPTTVQPTLTDFNGSAVAVGDPLAGMQIGQAVDKAMNMDMEALRKLAGLSY